MSKRASVPFREIAAEWHQDPAFAEAIQDMKPYYELVNQIIKARTELGLTQAQLAARVGTKQSNISRLERGDCNPSLEFIQKVATSLGKSLHVVLE
jgi:predicted transcriptional regulator